MRPILPASAAILREQRGGRTPPGGHSVFSVGAQGTFEVCPAPVHGTAVQEQVDAFSTTVFDNGRCHDARRADVFASRPRGVDILSLDPPYVSRADDNRHARFPASG